MSFPPDSLLPAMQNFVQAGQALASGFLQMLEKAATPGNAGKAFASDGAAAAATAAGETPAIDAQALVDLQRRHCERQQELWTSLLQGGQGEPAAPLVKPQPGDRRFDAPAWHNSPLFDYVRQSYLLNADYLRQLVELVPATDDKTRERQRFFARQYIDALSPANYAVTNPEFIERAIETKGRSITDGINNLIRDVGRGRISMSDESAFALGENLATTPGSVVFENDVMQLIQYAPLTPRVARRPLLIVPPCINKFYILDLQEQNSFVRHALLQGNTVFLVSWRNPQVEHGHLGWDDYLERGPLAAIARVRSICRVDTLNLLGFCVGGTLLVSALAVLAARGEKPVASLTLLTTLLDFAEAGEISLFIDEAGLAAREAAIGQGGLLPARDLSGMFSALRANDLVWNYVAGNYLLGQTPPAFDLLYWNADSTNLPGPFACWYMRHLYHENALREPGRLSMCGVSVDLGGVDAPAYVLAAREDHIVPWQGAYRSARLLGGDKRFVLGASGHIAGVVNPASRNRRSYWTHATPAVLPTTAQSWLEGAEEHAGSWWNDWSQWLRQYADGERAARVRLGSTRYPPLEPAPGRYVREKA
ncbi:class I poly(R)-hydroxyalkanoic acid synthase [Rhodocyclus tenuis]|uniref:Polyhydroxyalkanoate synthase n=1 Tax=Rhodocyclus tenuis TaxID=1066 RepID=A0A840G043_RHOTE|nr:class I poly(R)-hydroxyalkanoic acid synthase [Rhodocyclus tenuis]MBB4247524.1 polyhydroxyalkanoate synthase [Rhodocyclus tenuis]